MNPLHGIRTAKDEEQHTSLLAVSFAGEIFQDVLTDQLLSRSMAQIGFRHDRIRISLRQFRARRKHASTDEIESRAGNQPANDAAGARFAHRVGRHNDVGELFSLHFDYLSGGIRVPQNSSLKHGPRWQNSGEPTRPRPGLSK